MKKTLLLLLLLLTSLASYAYDFEVDGICYNITSEDDKTVEVTQGGSYSGDVVIPEKVTYSNTEYTVTKIGNYAFYWCSSLASVVLPSSLTEIGASAFDGCTLESINLPSSVTTIDDYAFFSCNSLASIELPASLTTIGNAAFYYCNSLTSIELPASLTTIGYEAFAYCTSLASIELPASLTEIGVEAFYGCKSLQDISVSEANENYTSIDGVLYDKNVRTLICCPGGKSGEFTVPASVTTIGYAAFWGCTSLASIELPASLTEIGDWAFAYCTSLASIELPASVTKIGEYAFSVCSSLASIELPSLLTEIEEGTFMGCSLLASIKLPSSLTNIGFRAFLKCASLASIELPASLTEIESLTFQNCESLKIVTSLNPEPPVLAWYVFDGCPIEAVYVPNEAVMDYKTANRWKEFNIVGIDVTGISDIVANGNVNGAVDCYTLQGVRVKTVRTAEDVKSLRPGLYIVNGKKVVVR